MTEVIGYPSWHDRARAAYKAGGRTQNQIADEFGFPSSRAPHILGSKWQLYAALYSQTASKRREPGVLQRLINEGNITFKAYDQLSPAEMEKNKASHKKPIRRQEEPEMPKTREFIVSKDFINGKMIKKHTIKCCECGGTDTYFNHAGSVSTEHLPKEFSRKGWFVGKTERTDTCPSCLAKKRGPKPKQEKEMGIELVAPPVTSTVDVPALNAAMNAGTPHTEALKPTPMPSVIHEDRAMDRTERRLIFARLNEIYIDETKGYSADWTDAKVAADLGVPVSWVADVREADFGPEINASIVDQRKKEVIELGEKIDRHLLLIDKKIEQLQQLDEKVQVQIDNMEAAITRFDELKKSLEIEDTRVEALLKAFNADAKVFQEKFAAFRDGSLQK